MRVLFLTEAMQDRGYIAVIVADPVLCASCVETVSVAADAVYHRQSRSLYCVDCAKRAHPDGLHFHHYHGQTVVRWNDVAGGRLSRS